MKGPAMNISNRSNRAVARNASAINSKRTPITRPCFD
jgi:hypothetical protein